MQTGQQPHQPVEATPHHLPPRGLSDLHARIFQRTRADGDAVSLLLHRLEEKRQIVDRSGEVGIRDQDQVATRHQDTVLDAVSLAAVPAVAQHTDRDAALRWPLGGEARNRLDRGVGAAIIHDDNLDVFTRPGEVAHDRLEASTNARRFIEGGYDDRETGSHLHDGSSQHRGACPAARRAHGGPRLLSIPARTARSARSPGSLASG